MMNQSVTRTTVQKIALALLATVPLATYAQAPVDDSGKVIGAYEPALEALDVDLYMGDEEIPLLSDVDLEVLVGPIALYPDDLLAIVLPASAYPLQLVDAARFLEELEADPSLKPDPDWDDSIVALLNYPEVIELLNEDIDWTWRLGEAVVSQQGDVVLAVETFRDRAYAAGNLKSDSYQNVTRDDGVIEITPVVEDVIYVPYYEPERVVVYQPRPVYYYYPRSYPVYYYPYSSAYEFDRGYFWGVTTAFTIGWMSDSLHVYHHSYHGHPYYGRSYRDRWWYRRPTMNVYNTTYVRNTDVTINRYYNGDRWQPRNDRREYSRDYSVRAERVAHNRNYKRRPTEQATRTQTVRRQAPIEFRDRPERRSDANQKRHSQRNDIRQREDRREQVAAQREQRTAPATRQRQERREPVTTQRQQRAEPGARQRQELLVAQHREQRRAPTTSQRQTRQEPRERAAPQRQARQEPRERAAPQRQARQEPRERAAPQSQARQEPRERAAPQSQARQEPRERAAPQRQEKREARSEANRSEKRSGDSSGRKDRKERKARR